MTRHDLFRKAAAAISLPLSIGLVGCQHDAAYAFDNRISDQYNDRPKQRGSKPKDLGVAKRVGLSGNEYTGLKQCGKAPNCFVSSTDPSGEEEDLDADHVIPSWKWPSSLNKQQAFDELVSSLNSYPPGQSNVDGGGFQIVTKSPDPGYIYVQFESLKNGYIDDVEFAFVNDALQVRSSSRLGYLDFGVNAKRLNYIAKALRDKGWVAPGVDFSSHRNYFIMNELE